ncbi:MAG: hypothetical protein FJ271_18145 [Planctomycetes bacterium]|nr:hypothetical protein [Planctomycetota bacterium]
MSILRTRPPSAKSMLRYSPAAVRVEVDGVSYDARRVRGTGPDCPRGVVLQKINGKPRDMAVIIRVADQVLCSCRLGKPQPPSCPHVAALQAAGMIEESTPAAAGNPPTERLAGPVYRSLGDACRNGAWDGYSDADFELMAGHFGQC